MGTECPYFTVLSTASRPEHPYCAVLLLSVPTGRPYCYRTEPGRARCRGDGCGRAGHGHYRDGAAVASAATQHTAACMLLSRMLVLLALVASNGMRLECAYGPSDLIVPSVLYGTVY